MDGRSRSAVLWILLLKPDQKSRPLFAIVLLPSWHSSLFPSCPRVACLLTRQSLKELPGLASPQGLQADGHVHARRLTTESTATFITSIIPTSTKVAAQAIECHSS